MAEYTELENFIMQKININTIMSEDDFLEALSNLSSSEQRRLKAKGQKPGSARNITRFGEDGYYERFNSKIGDRIDIFKEWEKKVDSYFDKTDKATTLDELAQFEKEITGQEWEYRLKEQIKYKRRVLESQSRETSQDLKQKIEQANLDEINRLDPTIYKGKISENSLKGLRKEYVSRLRDLAQKEDRINELFSKGITNLSDSELTEYKELRHEVGK